MTAASGVAVHSGRSRSAAAAAASAVVAESVCVVGRIAHGERRPALVNMRTGAFGGEMFNNSVVGVPRSTMCRAVRPPQCCHGRRAPLPRSPITIVFPFIPAPRYTRRRRRRRRNGRAMIFPLRSDRPRRTVLQRAPMHRRVCISLARTKRRRRRVHFLHSVVLRVLSVFFGGARSVPRIVLPTTLRDSPFKPLAHNIVFF